MAPTPMDIARGARGALELQLALSCYMTQFNTMFFITLYILLCHWPLYWKWSICLHFAVVLVCSTSWESTPGLNTGRQERKAKLPNSGISTRASLNLRIASTKKDVLHNYINFCWLQKMKNILQTCSESS